MYAIGLLTFLFIVAELRLARAACPSGWTFYEETNRCYKMAYVIPFDEAVEECTRLGGSIVSIHSPTENNAVSDFAKTGLKGISTSVWIGLHDPGHNGHWQWIDGTPFNFEKWAPTEPDNLLKIQYCVRLIADATGAYPFDVATKWDDVQCDLGGPRPENIRGAVCQRPAEIPTYAPGPSLKAE